jgi:hypothetical protein
LPPEDFVAARDQLSKQLHDDGKTEEAKQVKSLRRPTVPAWAINQVVRQHPEELRELLKAGDELRRAQQKALSGVKGADLRDAADRRRAALQPLVDAAEVILEEADRSSAGHTEAAQATFESASVDDDAAGQVREGRLVKELPPPSGFGAVSGLAVVPGESGQTKAATAKQKQADERARQQAERERRAAQEAEEEAQKLDREARDAERRAFKAEQDASRARTEASRLRKKAEELRRKSRPHSRA